MHGLYLRLLGSAQIESVEGTVVTVGSRKALALLGFLVQSNASVSRSRLTDLLWPELAEQRGRRNLSRELSLLSALLPNCFEATYHTLRWSPTPDVRCDLTEIAALLHEHAQSIQPVLKVGTDWFADHAPRSDDATPFERATALYTGELLDELYLNDCPDFESWLVGQREHLRQQMAGVYQCMVAFYGLRRQDDLAQQYAQRWLALEPWQEEAHRALMLLLARNGKRSAALEQFERCRRTLAADLGVQPSSATQALAEQVRAEQVLAQPVVVAMPEEPAQPEASAAAVRAARQVSVANAPVPPTPFIGRRQEIAIVCDQFRRNGVRMLTLTGPGGTGKTRLAIEVAAVLASAYSDGVWFIDLAPVHDPSQVAVAIARALRLPETAGSSVLDDLKMFLRDKQILLLLDNFEQLLPARTTVADLLRACPQLTLLATSRILLGVYGECDVLVPPLGLPGPADWPTAASLAHFEATRLFVERAQAAQPGFAATDDWAEAVAEICRRLDGLPLAIELAAARVRLLSPPVLLTRLGNRLKLLTGGGPHLPTRQQTLRATMEWSYQLLQPDNQALLQQLSVFAGSWSLAAVETMIEGQADANRIEATVLDGMATLLDNSLLRREASTEREPRFVLLETVREYAFEQLSASGNQEEACRRHAIFYAQLARTVCSKLQGAEHVLWMRRLEADYANLRAAFNWLLSQGEATAALQLALDLWYFWVSREWMNEGRAWLEAALARLNDGAPLRGLALARLGDLAHRQGDFAGAQTLCENALELCRAAGDEEGHAFALLVLGHVASHRGDTARAIQIYEQSSARFREQHNPFWLAWNLYDLACMVMHYDLAHAEALLEESTSLFRQQGFERAMIAVLAVRGQVATKRNNLAHAQRLLEESIEQCQRFEHPAHWHTLLLARLHESRGNVREARHLYEESLALYEAKGVIKGCALAYNHLGWLLLSLGEYAQADRFLAQSLDLFTSLADRRGIAWSMGGIATLALYEGDRYRTVDYLSRALDIYQTLDHALGLALCLYPVVVICQQRAMYHDALLLLAAAVTLHGQSEMPPAPAFVAMQDDLRVTLQKQTNASAATLWAEGQALSDQEVVSLARAALAAYRATDWYRWVA